jgi:hypothetical protein
VFRVAGGRALDALPLFASGLGRVERFEEQGQPDEVGLDRSGAGGAGVIEITAPDSDQLTTSPRLS